MRIDAILSKTNFYLLLCFMIVLSACSPKAAQVRPEESVKAISISSLEIGKSDGRSILTIKATEALQGNYTVIKVTDPPKVVIEMPTVDVGKFEGTIDAVDGAVAKVTTSRLNGTGAMMEVSLVSLVEHEVRSEGNTLEIYFAEPQVAVPAEKEIEAASSIDEKEQSPTEIVEEPKKEEKAEAPKKALKVKAVEIKKEGKFTRAEIITDGEISDYNVFNLKSPARVVVDVRNAREITAKRDIKAVSPHIKGARLGRHDGQVRIVFDYKGSVKPYEVVKENDRISILFGKTPAASLAMVEKAAAKEEAPKVKVEEKIEEKAEAPNVGAEMAAAEARPETQEAVAATEAKPEVKEEVITETKPEAQKEVSEAEVKTAEKEQTEVAKEEQKEVAKEEQTEVAKEEQKVRVAERAEEKTTAKEKAVASPVVEVAVEEKTEPEAGKKISAEGAKEEMATAYHGQKVTLEFKDADIKNIFRIIAEVSGYNMIIDNAVAGKVTIRLVNVPWDQALDLLLETNNLGMKKVGNVIRVLPAAFVKKEEEDKQASKKAKEKLEDMVTKLIPVSYASASDLSAKLKGVMTDRGTTLVDERTNTIILKDIQESVDEAVKLVASLDAPTPQVVIEARIVEANTNFTRDLGVQWGAGQTADAAHGNPTGYYFPNSYNVSAGGGGSFALNPPTTGSVGASDGAGGVMGISFGSINNTLNLDLRLSALETQGWGKVISSPKIITLDNKEASIQQGISIPFETTSSSGTQTTFVDANLNLTVTPHVTADGRLSMKIKATKNAPSLAFKGASGAPSIDKKEASTEILVKDGDTTVIGGIYQITKAESESFTPFLGKLPIIGWLFKSKSVQDTKTELLIFITPRIVRDKPI